MSKYSFLSALEGRKDLKRYSNRLTLFALQLFFGIEDIEAIAADDVIVDGSDDGALDIVHIDTEQKFAVIGQEYVATGKKTTKKNATAPAAKARGLSSGLSLLIAVPIEEVPEKLRSSAKKLREALANGEIDTIHIWYVHNLPGSKNAKKELRTAETTARAHVGKDIEIRSFEVCAEAIEERYKSISTPILVGENFEVPIYGVMPVKENDWEALVTSVPLRWLYVQFKKYGTNLFSANVRDYLGISKKIDKNINKGIQDTAKSDPEHFWIFNNGMTALVHDFVPTGKNTLKIKGISILNGAQTTGAIGNLSKIPNKSALVQVRFVKCFSEKTVIKIKRYNNSQNKIEATDFRSRDLVQKRLQREFKNTDINYLPRRGGVEDIIKRKPNALSSILAGQVIATLHGRPDVAYHEKTKIWEDDNLYIKYFNEDLSAKHIIFSYALFEAVKNKKLSLVKKEKDNALKTIEQDQLSFFQTRGSVFLLAAAIANCLEIFIDKKISNKFKLEFRSKKTFGEAVKEWEPLVEIASQLSSNLMEGFSEGAIRETQATEAIKKFSTLIATTKESNKEIFSKFAKDVSI